MKTLKVKAGVPQKMDDSDTSTFEQWMKKVDRYIGIACGLSYLDLPDCLYCDWYVARVRPIRAANRALRSAHAEYSING